MSQKILSINYEVKIDIENIMDDFEVDINIDKLLQTPLIYFVPMYLYYIIEKLKKTKKSIESYIFLDFF